MAQFDLQINDIKNRLASAQNVLVVLPSTVDVDKLASGLSLYLSLKASGKNASIVSEATPMVSHANLFGVGDIKNTLPAGSGNFVLSLDGVVDKNATDPAKKVPTLEKLDWYPQDSTLNLVFHVVNGQRFEPTNVRSSYENGGFQLIFVVGAATVAEIGGLYIQNSAIFSQNAMVNIDTSNANTSYGSINIISPNSGSLTEVIAQVISGAGLNMDADIATNILVGVYDATANLTQKVGPDTFLAASTALQAGGKLPNQAAPAAAPVAPVVQQPQTNVTIEQSQPQPSVSNVSEPNPLAQNPFLQLPPEQQNNGGFDLRDVFQIPSMPSAVAEPAANQPGVQQASQPNLASPQLDISAGAINVSSPEERPMGEYAQSSSPEMDSTPTPDWLVPKIFKGGNLG